MTVLGCIEDGLSGRSETLRLKSTLDGFASLFLAASLGVGVLFSALAVLIVQGGLTLAARPLAPLRDRPEALAELTGVGGPIIMAVGLGLLDIKHLPVADYLPALALAPGIAILAEKPRSEAEMRTLLGMGLDSWLILAAVVAGMFVARGFARLLARSVLRRRDQMHGMVLPESVRRATLGAAGLCAAAAVGAVSLPFLAFSGRAMALAERVIEILALVAGALFALALLEVAAETLEARAAGRSERAERLLVPVTRKIARAAILIVAGLTALGVFGVNVAGVIAGLGITGLVLALAAKDSVENLFGSFTLLFDMPFALGDWIRVNGIEGCVEEINLRSTRLRTADDSVVLLPNANFVRASVENLGPRRYRRQKVTVPIGHPTPVEATERFLAEVRAGLASREDVDPDRIVAEAGEYAEGTLNLLIQFWTLSPDFASEMRSRGEALLLIERLRAERGLHKPGF